MAPEKKKKNMVKAEAIESNVARIRLVKDDSFVLQLKVGHHVL